MSIPQRHLIGSNTIVKNEIFSVNRNLTVINKSLSDIKFDNKKYFKFSYKKDAIKFMEENHKDLSQK